MIYALVGVLILEHVGLTGASTVDRASIDMMKIFELVFCLMGEEFVKFIPFMFFMRIIFKFTGNRKQAIVMSMIIVMVMFAGMHSFNMVTLIFAIFIQGIGSIFEFYGYIKTKNMLIPYITHLCTDVSIMLIAILGI